MPFAANAPVLSLGRSSGIIAEAGGGAERSIVKEAGKEAWTGTSSATLKPVPVKFFQTTATRTLPAIGTELGFTSSPWIVASVGALDVFVSREPHAGRAAEARTREKVKDERIMGEAFLGRSARTGTCPL
jgi:hypothetical protein